LDKLKLPGDVAVQTNEVQSTFRKIARFGLKRVRWRKPWTIFAAAPQQAMKTSGRHQVVANVFAAKTQRLNQMR
jgi:hypothetical protein